MMFLGATLLAATVSSLTTAGAPWSMMLVGFGLGLRHAAEPDHMVAVTTLTTGAGSPRAAGRIGVIWGLGHSATVLAVGLAVLALGRTIPDTLSRLLEGAAGGTLLALAAWSLLAPRPTRAAVLDAADGQAVRWSFLVGTIHGLAGSAAVTLLLVTSGRSAPGVAGLLAFGAGTTLGMGLLAGGFSRVLTAAARHGRADAGLRVLRGARVLSALASSVVGAWLVFGSVRGG